MKQEKFVIRPTVWREVVSQLRGAIPHLTSVTSLCRFGLLEPGSLCFYDRHQSDELLMPENRSTILCAEELVADLMVNLPRAQIIAHEDPRALFVDLAGLLLCGAGIHVTDLIPQPFGIDGSARVGPHTIVDPESRIDEDVVIGAHCVVHRGVWIKRGAIVGDGCVLGGEGINAYRAKDDRVLSFPHLAGLIIGEDVKIGANAVLMRGVLSSTSIGEKSIIGNLCNIGHGVEMGRATWMSVGCKIGGHVSLGEHVTFGMGCVVRDNLNIGDGAQIGMGAVVVKAVKENQSVFGNPARVVPSIDAGPIR